MHRFFCQPEDIAQEKIYIYDTNEIHHARHVLRLKAGNEVSVVNGIGDEFRARIVGFSKKSIELVSLEHIVHKRPPVHLAVACAIPKRAKIDFIVEKLTEIGVSSIILLQTERTEVRLKEIEKKRGRFVNVAIGSVKQSGNPFLPTFEFLTFPKLVERTNIFDAAFLAHLGKPTVTLKQALSSRQSKNILVAIGPEGDFSEKEVFMAQKAGFVSVSLGSTVLKVDTAAIVAAGFTQLFHHETH